MKTYTRLTRNATGLAGYTSLWLGPDHIMIVHSTGYTENYSRVLFRDIKGLLITGSDRRLWWNLPWALWTLIAAIRVNAVLFSGGAPIASSIFLAIGVIMLTWNSLLGPGCRVYVMTGVQTAKLPALVRMRKARRVIARLQPLIIAAQADLPPAIRSPAAPMTVPGVEPPPAPAIP